MYQSYRVKWQVVPASRLDPAHVVATAEVYLDNLRPTSRIKKVEFVGRNVFLASFIVWRRSRLVGMQNPH
jgi:hypothetical protein